MKKYIPIGMVLLLLLSGCAIGPKLIDTEAQVLLDKDTGDTFEATDVDNIDSNFTELYAKWAALDADNATQTELDAHTAADLVVSDIDSDLSTVSLSHDTVPSALAATLFFLPLSSVLDEDDFASNSETSPSSQQATKNYVDTAIESLGEAGTVAAFDLDEDSYSYKKIWPFVAGASFSANAPVYVKTDGANGARVYGFDADATDAATYPKIGRAMAAGTLGNSVNVQLDGDYVFRNDSYAFTYNSHEGKPLWCGDGGAGYESLTKPSTPTDAQLISGIIIQVEDETAGTHDYVMNVPFSVMVHEP